MDEIFKKFLTEIQGVNDEGLRLELNILTNTMEWFEKSKKEHRNGKKCGFRALDKYFDALENEEKEDFETARNDIEEAKNIMESDADNGNSFVKEVFDHLIDSQYERLHK